MINVDKVKIVEAIAPATQAGGSTGLYISLKNVVKVHILVALTQAAANTVLLTINQATNVSGGSVTPITNAVNIWSNLDTATSDVLESRTAAVNYTTDAGQKNKLVMFEFVPSILSSGFDCINITSGASSGSNILSATYILETRYSGADLDAN